MFNKKQSQTIEKLHIGTFEIRLSESKIEIETVDKSWKQVYAAKTRPFAEFVALMAKNDKDSIHNLCFALYGTTLFFYYPSLRNKWIGEYNEVAIQVQNGTYEER